MKLVDRLLIGKDGIQMSDMMTFPDTWEEFEKLYGFNDAEEIYTNNSRLIPSFRVKQWLDHLPSVQPNLQPTCNQLATVAKGINVPCEDTISRQAAIDAADSIINRDTSGNNDVVKAMTAWKEYIKALPSVQPQKGKWIFIHPLQADDGGAYMCSNCQRGDWDIKPTDKYCKFCGCRMEEGDAE